MDETVKTTSKTIFFLPITIATFFFLASNVFALSNDDCLDCHSDEELTTEKEGQTISLFVNQEWYDKTVHAENGCVSCHEDAEVDEDEHPFPLSPVGCENCHDEINDVYQKSVHGQAAFGEHDTFAPKCKDCHTKHNILPSTNRQSFTYPLNIPFTCGLCHREGSEMTKSHELNKHNIIENYSMSIHGKGLFKDGLVVTAVCTSCHTAHNVQKSSNPESTVNKNNIIETCNQCHVGIVEQFKQSVHSKSVTQSDKELPNCCDCHNSHTIAQVSQKDFRLIIAKQCNNCHEHETETYFETYHGRASMLWGGEKTAKCSDCHGSHDILPINDARSKINENNIVKTCAQCHPKANQSFTTYLTHATHTKHDKDKYPYLYYTFWAMTSLLVGTFGFFWLHTIFWFPRELIEKIRGFVKKKQKKSTDR